MILENILRLKNQTYENCEVFVLDDSDCKLNPDLLPIEFKLIKRNNRHGFKAGALNNWINRYGKIFRYFVIIDADSQFDPHFVEEMLKYSEHEDNKNIAIFQSKLTNINSDSEFAKIISISKYLSNFMRLRMGNKFSMVLSQGHNNLHRTRHIQEIGGFSEDFTSEDYATSINLIKKGYEIKMVNVSSFDTTPETIKGYINRNLRWSRQNLEVFIGFKEITASISLFLLVKILNSFIWIFYLILIVKFIFGYYVLLFDNINFIYLLFIYAITFLIAKPLMTMPKKQSFLDYYKYLILNSMIGFYTIIPLIKNVFVKNNGFEVTDKNSYNYPLMHMILEFKLYNFLMLLVISLILMRIFIIQSTP
jgi:hypothetical protein